jgi:hypothetical protein
MALITTTEQLQKSLNVTGTFDPDSILPFVNDAQEKYLSRYLGATLLRELESFVTANLVPDWEGIAPQLVSVYIRVLLPHVENPLAAFAFFQAAPSLDIKITDSGFAVVSTANLAPASAERVKNFRASMEQTGFDRIESMLRFLEANKEHYPSWVNSEGYSYSTSNFITHADMFDQFVPISQSRLQFQRLRPTMDNVELLQIEPVISPALAAKIRTEIRTNTFTDPVKAILPLLRRAVAYLTAGTDIAPKYTGTGEMYLAQVKKLLDASPADYPEYSESDCYDPSKTTYGNFTNTENLSLFVFGS